MKTIIQTGILLMAGALFAADSMPKDDIVAAAKKLEKEGNYTWKSTVEFGNFTGTTEGKITDGVTSLSMAFGDNTTEAFLKGEKGAVKPPDQEWQSLEELSAAAGTEPGPRQFLIRRLKAFKAPAEEMVDLAGKTKEFKKDGDVCSSDLTEAGAKELLSFGRRRGGNAPEPKNAKGSVKFWTKDGTVSKYQVNVQGSMTINGEDRDIDRTTTVEIKEVGSTKMEVPEAAKKKMS